MCERVCANFCVHELMIHASIEIASLPHCLGVCVPMQRALQDRIRTLERQEKRQEKRQRADAEAEAELRVQQATSWMPKAYYVCVIVTIYAVYSLLSVAPSGVERKVVFVLSVPLFHSVASGMLTSGKNKERAWQNVARGLPLLACCAFLCGFVFCYFLRRRAEL